MNELTKNIGLGLFVNGLFVILNGDPTIQAGLITALSVGIMAICIHMEKRSKE